MPRKIRPIRIEGNIAYVTLTKGYEAVIDAANIPLVDGLSWRICAGGYAANKGIYLHRHLMSAGPGVEVDHIDGDKMNNRRSNLRFASRSQNGSNIRRPSHNTSGLKGASQIVATKRWRASIMLNGRFIHLGVFTTPEAAHAAYCEASTRLHGEFGRTK